MKVQELREGLLKLAETLERLRAKGAADDLILLTEFLAEFDEQTVQACLSGLRQRLTDRPAPVKKGKVSVPDLQRVQVWYDAFKDALARSLDLEALMARLSADKTVKQPDLAELARRLLGFDLTERTRPKALLEFRRLLARHLHGQERLNLA